MDNEKMEIAAKEAMELYNCGKYEELEQMANSEQESEERRMAAHVVLQFGQDPRRLI